MIQHQTSN